MPPVRKAAIAAPSPTATITLTRRSCAGTREPCTSASTMIPRNDSMMPDAARSWRNVLVFSGMQPTSPRWKPTEAFSHTSILVDRRERRVGSSWRS